MGLVHQSFDETNIQIIEAIDGIITQQFAREEVRKLFHTGVANVAGGGGG